VNLGDPSGLLPGYIPSPGITGQNACLIKTKQFKKYVRYLYHKKHVSRDNLLTIHQILACPHLFAQEQRMRRAWKAQRRDRRERDSTSTPPIGAIQHLAWKMAKHAWHSVAQAKCLIGVINIEDNTWQVDRMNEGGSGAGGLPQALPASKMASAGKNWWPRPGVSLLRVAKTQLRWMISYIKGRIDEVTACGALAHEARGWY